MERFHEILEHEFERIIGTKTGWGKNELMNAFHRAFAIAVSKYASELGISLV